MSSPFNGNRYHDLKNGSAQDICPTGKCFEDSDIKAAILFPSAGCPLVIGADNPETVSVIIAAPAIARTRFRGSLFDGAPDPGKSGPVATKDSLLLDDKKTQAPYFLPYGFYFVGRDMRVSTVVKGKPNTFNPDSDGDRFLKGDGKFCKVSKGNVGVWWLRPFEEGIVMDRNGRFRGYLDAKTVDLYKKNALGTDLTDIYEVVIRTSALKAQCEGLTRAYSISWMMKTPEPAPGAPADDPVQYVHDAIGRSCCELSDVIMASAFHAEAQRFYHPAHNPTLDSNTLKAEPNVASLFLSQVRLLTSHPVLYKPTENPKIAHMTDLKLSSRQYALAKNPAKVFEGTGGTDTPVAKDLLVSYQAAANLIDQAAAKADVAVITGDVIDYYRDLLGTHAGNTIEKIWSACNIMANLLPEGYSSESDQLYPAGYEYLMFESLLKRAYKKNLPVYVTSGNQDAYAYPKALIPRYNDHFKELLPNTIVGDIVTNALDIAAAPFLASATGAIVNQAGQFLTERAVDFATGKVTDKIGSKTTDMATENYDPSRPASEEDLDKANQQAPSLSTTESIPASWNMTYFEAGLLYGPTLGESVSPNLFNSDCYAWYRCFLTPLRDWSVKIGSHSLVGCSWGEGETDFASHDAEPSEERQGKYVTPRSVDGITAAQIFLIQDAKIHKTGKLSVFSHFPIVSFGNGVPDPQGLPFTLAGRSSKAAKRAVNGILLGCFAAVILIFIPWAALGVVGAAAVAVAGAVAGKFLVTGMKALQALLLDESDANWNLANYGSSDSDTTHFYIADTVDGVDNHFSGHTNRGGVYHLRASFVSNEDNTFTLQKLRKIMQGKTEKGYLMLSSFGPKMLTQIPPNALGCYVVNVGNPNQKPVTLKPLSADKDPGLKKLDVTFKGHGWVCPNETNFIVTTSAGTQGIQNLYAEMSGGTGDLYNYSSWHLAAPGAVVLEGETLKGIKYTKKKPRLCVAVDHLYTQRIEMPLTCYNAKQFLKKNKMNQDAKLVMVQGAKFHQLNCMKTNKVTLVAHDWRKKKWERFPLALGSAFEKNVKKWKLECENDRNDVPHQTGDVGAPTAVNYQGLAMLVNNVDAYEKLNSGMNTTSAVDEEAIANHTVLVDNDEKLFDMTQGIYIDMKEYAANTVTIPKVLIFSGVNNKYDQFFLEVEMTGCDDPHGTGIASDFDHQDKWTFPVEFKVEEVVETTSGWFRKETSNSYVKVSLYRKAGDAGELPNWDWLGLWFKDSCHYPASKTKVIHGNAKQNYARYEQEQKQKHHDFVGTLAEGTLSNDMD